MRRAVISGDDDSRRGAAAAPPSPGERRPIHELTGLRFFAALLVAVSHFPEVIPIPGAEVPLVRQGAAGPTIFFVLSGFVMTYNYFHRFHQATNDVRSYLRARVARIFPMNVVALLIVTPVVFAVTATTPSLLSWFVNLFMLQSLVPVKAMNLWNIPAWSVSAELVFYCVFPFFVCWVLARVKRPRRLLALAATIFVVEVALFSAVAVLAEQRLGQAGKSPEDVTLMLERVKFFPGLRIWEFFLGCVMGLAFLHARDGNRHGWWRRLDDRRVRDVLVMLAGLGLLGILFVPSLADIPSQGLIAQLATAGLYVVYTPLAVILVTAVAWGPTTVSPVLEHRWAQVLGDASYSFYLLQWTVVVLVAEWGPSEQTWWISAAAIVVLIGASILSDLWIERPTRRLIRGDAARAQPVSGG